MLKVALFRKTLVLELSGRVGKISVNAVVLFQIVFSGASAFDPRSIDRAGVPLEVAGNHRRS